MKKLDFFSVVLVLLLTLLAAFPASASPCPEFRLSNEKGDTAICRIGDNPSTVDAERTATLFITDWNSQNAYKKYMEKQAPTYGYMDFWEGNIMSIFGSEVGVLTPQPIHLSWLIANTPCDIHWALWIKPRDQLFFHQVDTFQPTGDLYLWTANGNNCWAFIITAQSYVVPEPESLLALGSGLIGLVGFGLRRRQQ